MTFTAPIRLISEANQREHWAAKHRRKKQQQAAMKWAWLNAKIKARPPCTITITRIGARRLDSDNLAGACKHVQDQIARELGIDDGDERLTWRYEQEQGPYATRVTVTSPGHQADPRVPAPGHPWRAANLAAFRKVKAPL